MTHPFIIWPYAVKANVQHEWDTDHLNVWITFRHPMEQTVKPANAKWLCVVDSVSKTTTVSAWQDAWTLLLTVSSVSALPTRVTLEYDGPDTDLRTTWNKQWEPWGPILSFDGTLLSMGSFKGNEINWTQVAAQNVWYTISDVDITAGQERNVVFQNNQELKVSRAGIYLINYYVTVEISIANKHVLTAPEINGVEQPDGQMHHEFGRAGEEEGWAASAEFNLAVDDKISVGISTPDTGNPTLLVDHVGLTVMEGGHVHP